MAEAASALIERQPTVDTTPAQPGELVNMPTDLLHPNTLKLLVEGGIAIATILALAVLFHAVAKLVKACRD